MDINHWAVFTCAVFSMIWGAIWYSPALFYEPWKKANNLTDEHLKKANQPKMYVISFFLSYVMSYNLAYFLGDPGTDWQWGISAGFMAGFGWAAAVFTVIALFEQKSWGYILINSGYIVTYFTAIGFILGVWR